uniref:Uncharacterized protein n=1 Tax=Timema cristinae TaxID=61476 RepID=A0A7R9DAU9_TIMCR|nr:unnamed protein product [Timema cristinae]
MDLYQPGVSSSVGVYEAAVGLSSLLASSRSYLSSLELLTEEDPNTPTLLLLQALRTLPREEFQQISSSGGEEGGWDFMFDDQITSNKPYLGKFAGIIAQFQILEVFQNMTSNTTDILQAMEGNTLLRQLLQEGMSLKWPELLEKHFQIVGLDSEPLLRYFRPLEDFLDRQGSPKNLNPESRSGDSLTPVTAGTGVNATSTTNTTSPKTTSVGSAILIGCATVAAIGIVTTLFLIGRKRFKRGGHEYQIAKKVSCELSVSTKEAMGPLYLNVDYQKSEVSCELSVSAKEAMGPLYLNVDYQKSAVSCQSAPKKPMGPLYLNVDCQKSAVSCQSAPKKPRGYCKFSGAPC